MLSIVEQLAGFSPVPKPKRNPTAEILNAMSDGEVWDSLKLSKHLDMDRALVSVLLHRLLKRGNIRQVPGQRVRPVRFVANEVERS
jgi:DNA-binding IclR family transcriptional regulator